MVMLKKYRALLHIFVSLFNVLKSRGCDHVEVIFGFEKISVGKVHVFIIVQEYFIWLLSIIA